MIYINKKITIDSAIISKIVCMSFCDFLFYYRLSDYQIDLLYQSSLEWRKEISIKGKGDISEEVSDRRYWKTETYGGTKQSY